MPFDSWFFFIFFFLFSLPGLFFFDLNDKPSEMLSIIWDKDDDSLPLFRGTCFAGFSDSGMFTTVVGFSGLTDPNDEGDEYCVNESAILAK